MSDCSDSEEFYDAEEFTPIRGSKRPSLNSSPSITDSALLKDKKDVPTTSRVEPVPTASTSSHQPIDTQISTQISTEEDRAAVKNVVEDRKRFMELRRCMQAEEEDEGPDPSGSVDHSVNMEHPFKIRAHDTMSLQSMTSLGRIGRILSGAAESHPNMLESCVTSHATVREPETHVDDTGMQHTTHNVLAMCEPDVIASTKANSLKHRASAALDSTAPRPQPPPRRKKRNKLHGSQTLSTTDGDNLSLCTNDTDDCHYAGSMTHAHAHLDEADTSSLRCQQAALPSPASTIESLTRAFRASLQMPQSSCETDAGMEAGPARSSSSSRSSTVASNRSHRILTHDDSKDDSRGSTRTHSDSRPARGSSNSEKSTSSSQSRARSRRRSAGDERATSGDLSDREILEQVTVLNLDTGEKMPLSLAEQKIPQCINPLSLHIMRLTSEYIPDEGENTSPEGKAATSWRMRVTRKLSISTFNVARKSDAKQLKTSISEQSLNVARDRETDEESESVCAGGAEDDAKEAKQETVDKQTAAAIRKKTEKFKRFLGSTVKKTVVAAKSLAQEVSHARHKEDVGDIVDDVRGETNIKLKASNSHKGPYDFDQCVRHVQEMEGHTGAVWCCRFSVCGRLLATAGQDKLLRVWVARDAEPALQDMRKKYNAKKKSSPTPSQESLSLPAAPPPSLPPLGPSAPFCPQPFAVYSGHTSDLLDVSWSKNYFLLSSSMDKTVRLWHISRAECLCCFQHIDFVTAIVFHPRDDRYFLSGSLDGKLRLWNIPDKKVAVWNEVDGKTKLITAANFCQNGKFAVVGTYDGRCIFYTTDQLKYHTQIDVRSTRGKNSTGRKISGIEPMPNDDKILITSNDSRIRLYDLRDLNLSCKYKGYVNVSSQIKASFSHDGKYIVSGSENQCIFIWKTYHDYSKFTSVRRDRNDFWEGIKAHNAVVTCTIFAPNPDHVIRMIAEREAEAKADGDEAEDKDEDVNPSEPMVSSSQTGHVLVSADFNGCIKVFVHKAKPKHSSLPASALA